MTKTTHLTSAQHRELDDLITQIDTLRFAQPSTTHAVVLGALSLVASNTRSQRKPYVDQADQIITDTKIYLTIIRQAITPERGNRS